MRSDSINHGRNKENVKYRDDRYTRCKRCGFICNTDRDIKAQEGTHIGWGISYVSTDVCSTDYDSATVNYDEGKSVGYNEAIYYDQTDNVGTIGMATEYDTGETAKTYDAIDKTIYDPIVKSGCPQCGTLLYNK